MTLALPGRAATRDWFFTAAIATAIAVLYWPASNGQFIWDDKLCFHDAAWLRYGDEWTHYLFRDFCQWVNYFRPLSVALLTLEIRLFDAEPGAMHVVSIGMHVANTLLVGLLARRLIANEKEEVPRGGILTIYASMLFYGLHPALVEPVVWIGCQYDLAATLFVLLTLLANTLSIGYAWLRAAAVGACFFLAACCKESALALPPLLVVFDLATTMSAAPDWPARLRTIVRRQWRVYVALAVAGAGYLMLRRWALGVLVKPLGSVSFFSLAHFQEVFRVYIEYLRVIAWPFSGLGPLHITDPNEIAQVSWTALAVDLAAIGILAAASAALLRAKPIGYLLLAATAALLPVLHVLPVTYDASLFHERYAMIALAAVCALLPLSLAQTSIRWRRPLAGRVALAVFVVWIACASVNVRVTVPLWRNDVTLWQWAARTNPDSIVAKDHLLTAYLNENDHARAHAVARSILDSGRPCASCMLNVAFLAISEKDSAAAGAALEKMGSDPQFLYDSELLRLYIFAEGEVLALRDDLPAAETAYRESVRMEPLDPKAKHALALLLVREGKSDEARLVEQGALALFAPGERVEHQREFDAQLDASAARP